MATRGQRSLVGYSPWGHKESDMTEQLIHMHTTEYHSAIKKNESFAICDNMDGTRGYHL